MTRTGEESWSPSDVARISVAPAPTAMARPVSSIVTTLESSTDHVTAVTNNWPWLSRTDAMSRTVSSTKRFAESGRSVRVLALPCGGPAVGGGGVNAESQAVVSRATRIGTVRTGAGIYPDHAGGANWRRAADVR